MDWRDREETARSRAKGISWQLCRVRILPVDAFKEQREGRCGRRGSGREAEQQR